MGNPLGGMDMKKVYSWKTLLVTIFLSGGCFIYKMLHLKDFIDLLWLVLLARIFMQGLCVSFSKNAYEADIARANRGKKVYRKLFGKFAPFAPYGSLFLLMLSALAAILIPDWEWLIIILLLSSVLYGVCLGILCKKHMKIEEEQEKSNEK